MIESSEGQIGEQLVLGALATGPRSLWHQAGLVQVPTLVVWGAEDRLVPVELAGRTAASVPDSRLLVLPGVGHVAQLEAPETTARATLALIEDAAG